MVITMEEDSACTPDHAMTSSTKIKAVVVQPVNRVPQVSGRIRRNAGRENLEASPLGLKKNRNRVMAMEPMMPPQVPTSMDAFWPI